MSGGRVDRVEMSTWGGLWMKEKTAKVKGKVYKTVQRLDMMWDFYWEWPEWTGLEMRTSERQSGSVIWRQSERGKVEMVWMCTRKRWWIIWENDVEDGAADRKKGRLQRGFIDLMKEDMKRIGVTEEDKKKVKWKQMICCNDLIKEKDKKTRSLKKSAKDMWTNMSLCSSYILELPKHFKLLD